MRLSIAQWQSCIQNCFYPADRDYESLWLWFISCPAATVCKNETTEVYDDLKLLDTFTHIKKNKNL